MLYLSRIFLKSQSYFSLDHKHYQLLVYDERMMRYFSFQMKKVGLLILYRTKSEFCHLPFGLVE